MRIIVILMASITLFLFTSCERNAHEQKQKYSRYLFESGKTKLYTKGGEITDTSSISAFIKIYDYYTCAGIPQDCVPKSFNDDEKCFNEYNFEIEILSDTQARFIYGTDSVVDLFIKRKNGVIYFSSFDTVQTYSDIKREMLEFEPLFIKTYPIKPRESFPITKYIPCKYAYEVNGEIHFPIISYKNQKQIGYSTFFSRGGLGINNSINSQYLSTIGNDCISDTIVFKQSEIIFK
jgi:hypothetical protein